MSPFQEELEKNLLKAAVFIGEHDQIRNSRLAHIIKLSLQHNVCKSPQKLHSVRDKQDAISAPRSSDEDTPPLYFKLFQPLSDST